MFVIARKSNNAIECREGLSTNSHIYPYTHQMRDQPHPLPPYPPQTDVEGKWLEQPLARNGHHWLIVANELIAYTVGPNPWCLASNNASFLEIQKGRACSRAEWSRSCLLPASWVQIFCALRPVVARPHTWMFSVIKGIDISVCTNTDLSIVV